MKSLGLTRKKRVGIEITKIGVHAAALGSLNSKDVIASTSVDFQIDDWWQTEAFSDIEVQLKKFVLENKLKGAHAVISVPNDRVILRYLKMPALPEKALRQAIEVEIGSTIHLPFENPVFDIVQVPSVETVDLDAQMQSVCLIAAPTELVSSFGALAKTVGLKPIAVDITPLALWRTIQRERVLSTSPRLLSVLLQVSSNESTISLFVDENMYLFRPIERGLKDEANDVEISNFASDITYEIQRVRNFFNFSLSGSEIPLQSVFLQSDSTGASALAENIGTSLGVKVNVIDAEMNWADLDVKRASYNAAIGLARKEVSTR